MMDLKMSYLLINYEIERKTKLSYKYFVLSTQVQYKKKIGAFDSPIFTKHNCPDGHIKISITAVFFF